MFYEYAAIEKYSIFYTQREKKSLLFVKYSQAMNIRCHQSVADPYRVNTWLHNSNIIDVLFKAI